MPVIVEQNRTTPNSKLGTPPTRIGKPTSALTRKLSDNPELAELFEKHKHGADGL